MVPGEICVQCFRRSNRSRKTALSTQKSAEAIVSDKEKDQISRSLEYDRERRND